MDYGYSTNLVYKEPTVKAEPSFTATKQDVSIALNPYATYFYRPDLAPGYEEHMNPKDPKYDKLWGSLTPSEKGLFLSSKNEKDFYRRLELKNVVNTAKANWDKDNEGKNYGTAIAATLIDPTILIGGPEIKGLFTLGKAASSIGKNIALGAGLGTTYELQLEAQGREDANPLHGGLIGAGIGTIAGVIGARFAANQATKLEELTHDGYQKMFSNNTNITVEKKVDKDGNVVTPKVTNLTPDYLFDLAPEKVGSKGVPEFFQSSLFKVMNSDIDSIRAIGFRTAPIGFSNKFNGELLVQGDTAWNIRKKTSGYKDTSLLELQDLYKAAKEEGFKGSEEDFFQATFKQYTKEVSDWHNIAEDIRGKFMPKTEASAKYREYFRTMLKVGKELGVKMLKDIDEEAPYFPVMYDFKRINTMKSTELNEIFYNALKQDSRNSTLDEESLREAAIKISDMFKHNAFSINFYDKSVIMPGDLKMSARLKARTLHLNHSQLTDIIDADGKSVLERYSHSQSGTYAMHWLFGEEDVANVMNKVKDEAGMKGIDITEDFVHLENILRAVKGDIKMPSNPTGLGLKTANNIIAYNNISNGWFFGLNSLGEISNVLWGTSWKNIFTGDWGRALRESSNLMHFGTYKESSSLAKSIISMGYMSDAVTSVRTQMFEGGASFSNYMLDKGGILDKMQHSVFKGSLLYTITDALEYFAGSGLIRTVMDIADKGKLVQKDAYKLARWGLTKEHAVQITNEIRRLGINNIHDLDLNKLPDTERHLLENAISNAISTSVLQADSLHVPEFMLSNNPFTKIITQWMKFPLMATNALLQRGIREDKVGLVAAAAISGMTVASIGYLREQALIALGLKDSDKQLYDINTDEGRKHLMMKALSYMGSVGMLQPIAQMVLEVSGHSPTNFEKPSNLVALVGGPTLGKIDDLIQTFPDALDSILEGHLPEDRKTYAAYQQLIFLLSMPIIGDIYKQWADQKALEN